MSKVLISYFSKSGNTKAMAEYIKEGLDSLDDIDVDLKKVQNTTIKDLRSSDGIVIGSPTYFGVMATEVKELMDKSIQCYGPAIKPKHAKTYNIWGHCFLGFKRRLLSRCFRLPVTTCGVWENL